MVTVFEKEGAAKKFFVSSGTITINDDSSVQILAEEAHPVDDLDAGMAKQVCAAIESVRLTNELAHANPA